MSTFEERLTAFVRLLEKERNENTLTYHPTLDAAAKRNGRSGYNVCGHDAPGLKFVRVWNDSGVGPDDKYCGSQKMVCYFVEISTKERIYGAEGWKKPNSKRLFGTLATMDEWYWGRFYAVSKQGLDTLVPKGQRFDDVGKDGRY